VGKGTLQVSIILILERFIEKVAIVSHNVMKHLMSSRLQCHYTLVHVTKEFRQYLVHVIVFGGVTTTVTELLWLRDGSVQGKCVLMECWSW
jgi:hypothetical protein